MKKIILIILPVICLTSMLDSQTLGFQITDGASSSYHKTYLLADNRMTIIMENEDCDSLFVQTDNGTINRDEKNPCVHILRPTKYEVVNLTICKIEEGDTSEVETKRITVRPWPFTALYALETSGPITKNQLMNGGLTVESMNTGLSAYAKILSFELTIFRDDEVIYSQAILCGNKKWMEAIRHEFKKIKSNDIVRFTDINYRYFSSEFDLFANDIKLVVE